MAQIKVNIQGSGTTGLTSAEITALYENLSQYTDDSYISGNATADSAYDDEVNELIARFPELHINAAKWYVKFKDPEVLRVLLANGVGSNGDITKEQLAALTNIGTWFKNNAVIVDLDILAKTGMTQLRDYQQFLGCTSLRTIDLSNIVSITNQRHFEGCTNLERVIGKIKDVPYMCFYNCVKLVDIDETAIETAGGIAFYNCALKRMLDLRSLRSGIFIGKDTVALFAPKFTGQIGGSAFGASSIRKVIDIGNASDYNAQTFRDFYNCNIVIRNMTPTQNAPNWNCAAYKHKYFVYNINNYLSNSNWNILIDYLYEIGGVEWQNTMQTLAAEEGYTKPDNIGWDYEYIDYLIYGCEPPAE